MGGGKIRSTVAERSEHNNASDNVAFIKKVADLNANNCCRGLIGGSSRGLRRLRVKRYEK